MKADHGTSPSSAGRARRGIAIVLLVVAIPVVLAWANRSSQPAMEAALEANNHGVGCMEQFRYRDAVRHFEEVVRLAPDWLPGRINLGIALLNVNKEGSLKRARAIFQDVLQQDPDNLYAHFCLGILSMNDKEGREAVSHFKQVLAHDSNDASSWGWLGFLQQGRDDDLLMRYYTRALEINPYLASAVYNRYQLVQRTAPEQARALEEEYRGLEHAGWLSPQDVKYTQMGHYAEAIGSPPADRQSIGPLPRFRRTSATVHLAPAARWARESEFGNDTVGKVRLAVRRRFGAALVVLDYNHDGRPDLFLAGAVVEKGKVRDLLLRQEADGLLTDVTSEAGLATPRPTLGCCVADLDNDGYPDLLLTGAGVQKLFRNNRKGGFEDVSKKAGLDRLSSVCLGATAVDLDQDADLDLLVSEYASTAEAALARLQGKESSPGGGLKVYLHVGEAPAGGVGHEEPPPLKWDFELARDVAELEGKGAATGVAASDVDGDRDLDFIVLREQATGALVLNDRLLRFRRKDFNEAITPASAWNGALVLDVDHDRRSDLLLIRAGKPPLLLRGRYEHGLDDVNKWLKPVALAAPALRQAIAIDLDLDSWTDVVAMDEQGRGVFLHNKGGSLVPSEGELSPAHELPGDLVALTAADMNGDGFPDLIGWSGKEGVRIWESGGNGNHALLLRPVGMNYVKKVLRMRCNADGVGVWVVAQSGGLWAGQENTSLCAGLGQSRPLLVLGLGQYDRAQVLRLRWPDGSWQGEIDVPTGEKPFVLAQSNRMPGSCPILFTWNGERFVFISDFLGAGSMGEIGPDGVCRPPRSEESIKIEAGQLVPRQDAYELRIADPMSEIAYLDHLQLIAVDHPADVRVFPEERFVSTGPPPSQELIAFDRVIHPQQAVDHRGRDVTRTLRQWDRHTVDGFARRAWMGFAEEHAIELDFGKTLANVPSGERLYLCLAGWTDYAWPQSIWAAGQGGVAMQPPVLESQDDNGRWHSLGEIGFPAGLPRMMLVDVTGKVSGPACRLRIRTNLHVYWDQVFIAAGCRKIPADGSSHCRGVRATPLALTQATLMPARLMREHSPDGRLPKVYDHDRFEEATVTPPVGRRTRHGPVTLLLRRVDDGFVIFGPHDELAVRFDARSLPPLPAGWRRSFVLRSHGYCKDAGPFTATGATVEPLPFRGMSRYPSGPGEHPANEALQQKLNKRYNTRQVR